MIILDARVVALWGISKSDLQYSRITGLWADEFFNRSLRDIASAEFNQWRRLLSSQLHSHHARKAG